MMGREFSLNDGFNAYVAFKLIDGIDLRTRFGIFKDIFMIFMIISASRRDLFADG
jgi:hypothetical protein